MGFSPCTFVLLPSPVPKHFARVLLFASSVPLSPLLPPPLDLLLALSLIPGYWCHSHPTCSHSLPSVFHPLLLFIVSIPLTAFLSFSSLPLHSSWTHLSLFFLDPSIPPPAPYTYTHTHHIHLLSVDESLRFSCVSCLSQCVVWPSFCLCCQKTPHLCLQERPVSLTFWPFTEQSIDKLLNHDRLW